MALRAEILGPKKAEAIEVEAQPAGLLSPIETKAEPEAERVEPVDYKAEQEERARLALKPPQTEPEEEPLIEPWGGDGHPVIDALGLGPK